VTDIIAAIDHVTGCQQCGADRSGSVSDDFCSEECQQAWHAVHVSKVEKLLLPTPSPRVMSFYEAMQRELNRPRSFSMPAGAQIFRYSGTEWEALGTVTSGFTIQEER
jgi:DNA-binding helix-hairpin-helix protein with protein kinase domain